MRIHVVAAVLRIVFENEERRVVPEWRMRNRIDGAAHRQIVIRNRRLRCRLARRGSRGVIVRQAQHA